MVMRSPPPPAFAAPDSVLSLAAFYAAVTGWPVHVAPGAPRARYSLDHGGPVLRPVWQVCAAASAKGVVVMLRGEVQL